VKWPEMRLEYEEVEVTDDEGEDEEEDSPGA